MIKIVYLHVHGDVLCALHQWARTIPLDINFYGCIDSNLGCLPYNFDNEENIKIIPTIEELEKIIDKNTIIICYSSDIFVKLDSIIKSKDYKKVIHLHGNLPPTITSNIISHSRKYLEHYNCKNSIFIPKMFNYEYKEFHINQRKNFYSYIRNYVAGFKNSYLRFERLHDIIKLHGITLVNYGFYPLDGQYMWGFDVESKFYMPQSKATIHIKSSDYVSNSVCNSIYCSTPVLMLTDDYNNVWLDSIQGVYTFDTVELMADFMIKIENDTAFFKAILDEVATAKVANNTITNTVIDNSIKWINNIINEE